MKKLAIFIGRLGSGKTYVAKQYLYNLENRGIKADFVEVSNVVEEAVKELREGPVDRKDLQNIKDILKHNPRFLIDRLIQFIELSPCNRIVISGLREHWIHEELASKYLVNKIVIVEAERELRKRRRSYSEEQMVEYETRDDKIGISNYIAKVSGVAEVVANNFESVTPISKDV